MNGMSDEFFSGPGFAADQYSCIGMRNLRDLFEYLAHWASVADNVRKIVSLSEFSQKMRILVLESPALVVDQVLGFDRLPHHGGNQTERCEFRRVVAIGFEAQVDSQRADRPSLHNNWNTH